MRIAFNPSTVAALTTPPNNKDITFDLRGQNIFARGVKFYGTDTNTWRDIKVNNVSIGSHTLDLRNGSNTTLTNTNGVVTINSTWRPVVDNLTSNSTTSSLSANQGRVLAGLINGKSDSGHNHDGRYVRYYAVTTLDCNNLAVGLTAARVSATNAAHTNHSVYLYISDIETPFQIQIPDSNVPYIYKRYYSSGKWSGWFKLNAGYADSAGSVAWTNITGKPSSYTPSAHTHAWNSLTHSSTTENQAILTNGKANGWKLYTLNISGWNNAANNAHSHSNKSVLDGITSGLVNNWNTAYTFVHTITGTDTDKVINKWDEIVNFLAGITEDNKLNTLLNSKLSVYELADKTNVGTIKNNGIYYSTTDASSGTLTNSPFNTGFALINMTSYDGGDDLRRSRLAFNAFGEIKVSDDRGQSNTAETWYNVLTSKNSGISGSTIKLNGTSITVYSSGTADGRYVKKSGDTMTGALNFANGTWNLVGDDSYMGDCNISGHFGIKAANTTYPGIAFFNNASAFLGNLTAYSGNIKYGAYSLQFLDNGNTSVSSSTWTNLFSAYDSNAVADGQAICVWGQASQLSNLSTDTGDMSLWLKRVNAKLATLNMVLDGEYYANGNQRLAHVSEIPTSLKNPHALTISLNGTSQGPYDGSAAKNINITPGSIGAATSGHNHDDRYLKLTGGTMLLGDGLKFHANDNYFGTNADARIISLLDNNDKICDGGLIIDERATFDGKEYITELLRIRDFEFKWRGADILHSGNYSGILDSRYYTESEVNSLLSNKLNTSNFNWTNLPGKIVAGNEFNIVNAGFKESMWFNYLPINDRSKTATISSYHFGNGAKGYTHIIASGFIKNGSNSSYVLLGDGGHQTISSLSVNYANSSGSASYLEGGGIPGWGTLTAANGFTNVSSWDYGSRGAYGLCGKSGILCMQLDGYFYQNEGQYRVLDTSDVAGLKNDLTIHQYLSATDATWWPLIWGGSSHNNTSYSTGAVYKSHDVLSWQTSSQTLYATRLATTSIDLQNNRGISQVTSGGTSPFKGIKLPDLQSNGIGMFSKIGSGDGADEGGIIISADTSVIYNSFDTGWGLTIRDKDRGQMDISGDGTITFGVRQDYRAYSLGGFEKSGSNNSYVLLGGGDHKLESALNVAHANTSGQSWDVPIQGQHWSRLFAGISSVLHHSSIFSIRGSIGCVVFCQTFLVESNYPGNATIICLFSGSYTQPKMRALTDSNGNVLVDLYWSGSDCSQSSSTQQMRINVIANVLQGSISPITSLTNDDTIPNGYSNTCEFQCASRTSNFYDVSLHTLYANSITVNHEGSAGIYLYSSSGESSYSMQAKNGKRWVAGAYTDRYFIWNDTVGAQFNITNSGNIGIGTVAPLAKLSVTDNRNESWVCSAFFQAPSITNSNNSAIFIGKALSTRNAFGLTHVHVGDGSASNYAALEVHGLGNAQRWYYDKHSAFLHRADFASQDSSVNYMSSALQIREHGYGGTQADTWANAPRMSWHWSGRVQTQIGLASNNELYLSKNNFSNYYRLMYETGTWGINISGNAASATNADKLNGHHETYFMRTLGVMGSDWNDNIIAGCYKVQNPSKNTPGNYNFGMGLTLATENHADRENRICQIYFSHNHDYAMAVRTHNNLNGFPQDDSGWTSWGLVPTTAGNIASATKLQTARKIWGQSFNGTADVDNTLRIRHTTGNYCEGIRIQTGDGAWSTIILGATGDSGTNANAWSIHRKDDNNFAISRNSADGVNGLVMTSVGMGLGTTAPTQRLDVHGNIRATGQIIREGSSQAWVSGRNGALLRETTSTGYHVLWSLKTTNGSWDFGEYNHSGQNNIPVLSYITDTNFNSGSNTATYQIRFPLDNGIIALTKNIPSSLPANGGNADTVDGVHMDWSTNYTAGNYLAIWDNAGNCIRPIPKGSASVGYATSAGNADTVDGYHASSLWRSDGGTWNPGANISLTASGNNQEWSFDIRRNGYTGCYWHVQDSALGTLLRVNADNGKVFAPYNFVGNLEGNASSASSADKTRALRYSGTGSSEITAYQTNTSYMGRSGWASYIICNHGDGSKYYSQTIAMPFWGSPIYRRLENGTDMGWKKFYTEENPPSWDNVINKPSTFAPSAHTHKWADITDRITKLSQLTNDKGFVTGSVSGQTITINGSSTTWSNTWRPITDNYNGTDSGISLSQKGGNALYKALLNGYASSAGNADTVDGYHASQLAKAWSGSGTMNQVAQNNGNYFGMITGTGTEGFPNDDGGWTHVFQASYNNNSGGDGNTGNFWVTQIANQAGTTSPWIRSRRGGSDISTGWTDWVRIMTKNDVDNYYWADIKVSTSANTQTTPTFNTAYATNWFRARGNSGFYFQDHAGGWYMSDNDWIRTWGSKALYVNNTIRSTNYQAMYGSTSVSAAKLESANTLVYGTDTSSQNINTYLRGTTVTLQVKKGTSPNYNALQLTSDYIYCNNYCDMKQGAIVSEGNFTVNNNAYLAYKAGAKVGIGTGSPQATLDVQSTAVAPLRVSGTIQLAINQNIYCYQPICVAIGRIMNSQTDYITYCNTNVTYDTSFTIGSYLRIIFNDIPASSNDIHNYILSITDFRGDLGNAIIISSNDQQKLQLIISLMNSKYIDMSFIIYKYEGGLKKYLSPFHLNTN